MSSAFHSIGRDAQLIRARLTDQPHDVAHVEVLIEKLGLQIVEQLRIGRWIAGADVVERLDDAGAGEVTPEAVHVARGEETVVGARQPGGKLFATGAFAHRQLHGVGEGGFRDLVRTKVGHLAGRAILHDFENRAGLFHRRAGDDGLAAGGIGAELHLGKEGAEVIVLVLRPTLEGVIVALVAVEARGEEKVRGVLHRLGGFAQDLPIAGGRVVLGRAGRGDDLPDELVVWSIGRDFLADPIAEQLHAFAAEELRIHLQHVGPFVRPVVHEFRRADQLVDHGIALFPHGASLGDERAHLVRGGGQAGEIEIHTAQKIGIGAEFRRLDAHALPLGGHEFIDAAPGFRLLPGEPACGRPLR